MSYTAPNRLPPIGNSVHTLTDYPFPSGISSAQAWPDDNLAIYVPVIIPTTVVIRKLFVAVSSTAGAGNMDIGIYTAGGTRLASTGSTARVASNTEQVVDITDLTVPAGRYFLALAASVATDYYYCLVPVAPIATAFGVLTEASAFPLPATATFAISQTLAKVPIIGALFITEVS